VAHLARRLLAMVSIAGGGLLGAAPSAFATPDPTPSTSQTASAPASPTPPPPVTLPLRTGRAVPDQPDAPAADDPPDLGAAATLRSGLATVAAPPAASRPAPPVSAPAPPAIPAPAAPASPPPTSPSPNAHPPASSSSSTRPSDPTTPAPSAAPTSAVPPPDLTSYTVIAGDSLWSIAASQVAQHADQSPASLAAADVTPYWQAVCAANRSTLRSGDVNLIYPGEQITLPPMSG
jgi:hypothetical protein